MNRAELISLLPYISSLALSSTIIGYAWPRRYTRGANPYIWYMIGQSLWLAGYILELLAKDPGSKLLWDSSQWAAFSILTVSFPVFAAEYTEQKILKPKRTTLLVAIIPTILLLLIVTENYRHLVNGSSYLFTNPPIQALAYEYSPVIYAYVVYTFMVVSVSMVWLVQRFFHSHNIYRAQTAVIILGFLMLAAGLILSLFHFHEAFLQDSAPLMATIANATVAWGLFRYRIFESAPVERDKVFEAMIDPVVILDKKNTVIDINRSMLDMLGKNADETIGHSVKEVFDGFPIPIRYYAQVSHARVESSFEVSGKSVYYELTVWPIYNNHRQMTGRLYICHDITALKELEEELRALNLDLEKRVQARTQDLQAAYDTTLEGWGKALELRDKETEGHSRRVTELTLKLAKHVGVPEEEWADIRRGAILHDIGKMAIPDEILRKAGPLTVEERSIVKKHPETARQLLERIPFLHKAMEIPYCHHEKWDGTGYPRGLKGDAIPLAARIFTIADVWDALLSDRPYSKAWPREKAIQLLKNESGKQLDPYMVSAFLTLVEQGKI